MPSPALQLLEADEADSARAAWARRRPVWTRTDTTRWLDARSASVLAWIRRHDASRAPAHSANMGRWLKDERRAAFDRAHEFLAALGRDSARRERLNPIEVLS